MAHQHHLSWAKATIAMLITSYVCNGLKFKGCWAYIPSRDVHVERMSTPFGRSLFDFYRGHFHESENKKWVPSLPKIGGACHDDAVYVLRSQQAEILAALRLTRSKNDGQYSFLRSLCVSREHRRYGLALRLLEESLQDFDGRNCYCFASPKLEGLYKTAGFQKISSDEILTLPKWLTTSYKSMSDRWGSRELGLFIKSQSSFSINATQIVFLQHYSEEPKNTSTGWLLDDYQYFKRFPCSSDEKTYLDLHLQRWIWKGRNDASRIEEKIQTLLERRKVHLLWTGSTGADTPSNDLQLLPETYIVLDGTWQQAKQMYRKTPALWKLPQIALQSDVPPSKYILRGDYSACPTREDFSLAQRFSNGLDNKRMLCTAEVGAAIMDRCNDGTGANIIRKRLDIFQRTFPHRKNTADVRK